MRIRERALDYWWNNLYMIDIDKQKVRDILKDSISLKNGWQKDLMPSESTVDKREIIYKLIEIN